jgi:hypothetical protein
MAGNPFSSSQSLHLSLLSQTSRSNLSLSVCWSLRDEGRRRKEKRREEKEKKEKEVGAGACVTEKRQGREKKRKEEKKRKGREETCVCGVPQTV